MPAGQVDKELLHVALQEELQIVDDIAYVQLRLEQLVPVNRSKGLLDKSLQVLPVNLRRNRVLRSAVTAERFTRYRLCTTFATLSHLF